MQEYFNQLALKKVGVSLKLLVAGVQKELGYYGPYYAITALHGTVLPEVIRSAGYQFVSDPLYTEIKKNGVR